MPNYVSLSFVASTARLVLRRSPAKRCTRAGGRCLHTLCASVNADGASNVFRVSEFASRRAERARDFRATSSRQLTSPAADSDKAASNLNVSERQVVPVLGAAQYTSHEEFVSALLAMTGDPLEEFGGRIVTYRGSARAQLMIVGEAPGAQEDVAGIPFVGESGQLLDDVFTYAGFDTSTQVYVTNVGKRRPPENRPPTDGEVAAYLPLLEEEIRLVDPGIIVLAGAVALKAVLGIKGISRVRGKIMAVERAGKLRQVIPVFHPAYLLRRQSAKHDMKRDIDAIRALYLDMYPDDALNDLRRTKPQR
jgi:uracil-DNA glycosylase